MKSCSFSIRFGVLLCILFLPVVAAAGDIPDEFRIKREGPFEFAEKPTVTRAGDRVTVRFKTRAFCDVTVAIEDNRGAIIRHLASGVLGPDAPPPFQKDSLEQEIAWDGKDDRGEYVDDKDAVTVRVSLGLKPRFERTLYWSPMKRQPDGGYDHRGDQPPIMVATPDGVYVYESGFSVDHVRFYSHEGDYVRTVYPFPSDKIDDVHGLYRHTFPQDGQTLALKCNFLQTTMLTSGTNCIPVTYRPESETFESLGPREEHFGMYGRAATGMAVRNGRVTLAYRTLNRFATDGSSGGLDIYGPKTSFPAVLRRVHSFPGGSWEIGPRSLAIHPDGEWLYLAGYFYSYGWNHDGLHGIARMRLDGDEPADVFLGEMKRGQGGTGEGELSHPTSITFDPQGRLYVADYMNDRIQVFNTDGDVLKVIPTTKPAVVRVDPNTGEIWVFSWLIGNDRLVRETAPRHDPLGRWIRIDPALRRYRSFDDPTEIGTWPLNLVGHPDHARPGDGAIQHGTQHRVEVNFWTDPPTVWMVAGRQKGIQLLRVEDGTLRVIRDFDEDLGADPFADRHTAPIRQRIYANPATGMLYATSGKNFNTVTAINPETGRFQRIELPFNTEEMAFDLDGRAYLRSMSYVARYDSQTWREIPWDYGERQRQLSHGSSRGHRIGSAISVLPVFQGIDWHMGGMAVSPRGHIAVATYVDADLDDARVAEELHAGDKYRPRLYPGRPVGGKRAVIHVWDRHGQVVHEDAVPGLPDLYGVGIDNEDGLYLLTSGTRVLGGERYFNDMTGTLMKFKPGEGRILAQGAMGGGVPVPLQPGDLPDRPIDVRSAIQGQAWVQGEEWMYGGLGHFGKNRGIGCSCYNARFDLDYFGRSFAPELDRYSVAVLDSAGNLILRVGQYGNVDDGEPLVKRGGPPTPRSIGGDEVALFHGAYIATHTDRRLFIADPGNARIVGVKLGYHTEETVALKDVPDTLATGQ